MRLRTVVFGTLFGLMLLLRDIEGPPLRAPAVVTAGPVQENVASPEALETLVVNFPTGANVAGTLRVELDDGSLVREQSVLGAQTIVHNLPALSLIHI